MCHFAPHGRHGRNGAPGTPGSTSRSDVTFQARATHVGGLRTLTTEERMPKTSAGDGSVGFTDVAVDPQ